MGASRSVRLRQCVGVERAADLRSGFPYDLVEQAAVGNVVDEDGVMTVYTARDDYATVEQALANAGYDFEDSELRWFPQNEIEVPKGKALQNMRLMEQLEEADDVQTVSSNLNITDEVLAAFEA